MVIDTSAIIAIMTGEPGADHLVDAISADPVRLVSAATVLESSLVLMGRYGVGGDDQLDRFLIGISATVAAVDADQVVVARDAALRFGRGRHSAALNYGDCFSYALAATRGEPLLCTGNDFRSTDIRICR